MKYAIVSTGGKQYKVSPGLMLDVERLDGAQGATLRLDQVLAIRDEAQFKVGKPILRGAQVTAQIVQHPKGEKVINFKFKRRKGYHRKVGHRQLLTRLRVLEITSNGA